MDIISNSGGNSNCETRNIIRWTGMGVVFVLFIVLVSWNFALSVGINNNTHGLNDTMNSVQTKVNSIQSGMSNGFNAVGQNLTTLQSTIDTFGQTALPQLDYLYQIQSKFMYPEVIVSSNTTVPVNAQYNATDIRWLGNVQSFGANFCNGSNGACIYLQTLNTLQGISNGIGSGFCAQRGCVNVGIMDLAPIKSGSIGDGFCKMAGCQQLETLGLDFEQADGSLGTDFCADNGCHDLSTITIGAVTTKALSGQNFCANTGCLSLVILDTPKADSVGKRFCYNAGCTMLSQLANTFKEVTQVGDEFCSSFGCTSIEEIEMPLLGTTQLRGFCSYTGCPMLNKLVLGNRQDFTTRRVDSTFCSVGGCSKDIAVSVFQQVPGNTIVVKPTEAQCAQMLGGSTINWLSAVVTMPQTSTTQCPTSGAIVARDMQPAIGSFVNVLPTALTADLVQAFTGTFTKSGSPTIQVSGTVSTTTVSGSPSVTTATFTVTTADGQLSTAATGYSFQITQSVATLTLGTTTTIGTSISFLNTPVDLTSCHYVCVRQNDFA